MVTSAPFSHLARQQFMSLTTFRKSGQPVATPVWFVDVGGKLFVMTSPQSGKVKRLRHTARVTVAPCTASGQVLGPACDATAVILPADRHPEAQHALDRKYGWQMRILKLVTLFRRAEARTPTYLEIDPS